MPGVMVVAIFLFIWIMLRLFLFPYFDTNQMIEDVV
jgi:hypothetical protein